MITKATRYRRSSIARRSTGTSTPSSGGGELEADWRPLDNLRFGLKLGFQGSEVGDGQSAIDLMDRTAGDPNYVVIRPMPTIPSNCIVPVEWFTRFPDVNWIGMDTCSMFYSGISVWNQISNADIAAVPNNGEGIHKDLSGNELPNAPDMTTTFTVDYTIPLTSDWLVTLHADLYRQSEAWTRIFNSDPYDRLKPFEQVNLSAIFTNDDAGWNVMAYVKNVFDADNITGAFLNSDDTSLTTNVFLNEPRLYGLRVTKAFGGDAPWGELFSRSLGPYPFTLEVGGGLNRIDAPNETFRPEWVDGFTSPALPFPLAQQDEDLDWGDSREAKVTYAPGRWFASAGARFGRTNGTAGIFSEEYVAPGRLFSDPTKYDLSPAGRNFAQAEVKDHEEHTLVDFSVGRDVGMGLVGDNGTSKVSVGLRYAEFKSTTEIFMSGVPNYDIADTPVKYPQGNFTTLDHYTGSLEAGRTFRGAGLVLSWEASRRLFGGEDTGVVAADWSLSGGALHGQQKTAVSGDDTAEHYSFGFNGRLQFNRWGPPASVIETTIGPRTSSEDVTVPTFGASLGLSYEIDRFKVGAGYRWERYFDVLDGGIEEAKDTDRTIDGPYFKIAVGFGG